MKKLLSLLFVAALAVSNLSAQILVSTGSGGNYDITSYPGNFTGYYDGFSLIFRANHNNPASYAKMRIGGFAQVDIFNTAGNSLSAGDIKLNQIITLVYDGSTSRFQMVTTSGNVGGGGGGIAGSGSVNSIPKFTPNGSTLGNSQISDDGTNVNISGDNSDAAYKFVIGKNASSIEKVLAFTNTNSIDGAGTSIGFRSLFISTLWDQARISGITSNGISQGSLIFETMKDRSTATMIEAMRINGNGNIGMGATAPLLKLDVRGSNAKGATFTYENVFQVASNEASSPLALRMGIQTSSTVGNRYGAIEVDDGGTKRSLELQPNGGNVGIGTMSGTGTTLNVTGPSAYFYNPAGPMNFSIQGSLFNGSSLFVDGYIKINTSTPGANAILALKDGHIQTQQSTAPTFSVNPANVSTATVTGTDVAGVISYSITAAGGTGAYVSVIFNKSYSSPPVVTITPQNPIAGAAYNDKKMYVTSSTTGFTIYHEINANSGNVISSATASFFYMVIDR